MAIGTVEFCIMLFMRKGHIAVGGGRPKFQRLHEVIGERHRGIISGKAGGRAYDAVIKRCGPIDPVSEAGSRKLFSECIETVIEFSRVFEVAAITVSWLLVFDRERDRAVVTCPAVPTGKISGTAYSCFIPSSAELKLKMADPAGISCAVYPVGKDHGRHPRFLALLAEDYIAVMFGRTIGRDRLNGSPQFFPLYPPGRRGKEEE